MAMAQDYSAAMKWYRMAADQGDAQAQFSSSHVRRRPGRGSDYSADEVAIEWLQTKEMHQRSPVSGSCTRMAMGCTHRIIQRR